MREFTDARTADTPDEIWLCEHDPVFTQGIAGRAEHVLDAGDIPVVATNRGGQVTYHGPGQVVAYPLIDLKRLRHLRQGVRATGSSTASSSARKLRRDRRTACAGAPGIYVRLADPFCASTALTARRSTRAIRFAASARSPHSASRSAATAPTTASR